MGPRFAASEMLNLVETCVHKALTLFFEEMCTVVFLLYCFHNEDTVNRFM